MLNEVILTWNQLPGMLFFTNKIERNEYERNFKDFVKNVPLFLVYLQGVPRARLD